MKQLLLLFLLVNLFFTNNLNATNPPTNAAPVDGATDQTTTLLIDWLAVAGNVGYLYELDITPSFNSPQYLAGTTATNDTFMCSSYSAVLERCIATQPNKV